VQFLSTLRLLETIKEQSNDEYYLTMHGDATYGIPNGETMIEYSALFYEQPEKMKKEAEEQVQKALDKAEKISKYKGLLDGFTLCKDYCFNTNPFFSPTMFSEFVTPYLHKLIKGYKDMGFYTIKHTDGNVMPILDQIVQCEPHGVHSLDPQAGVDLAEVKKLYGDKVCLIGNVNCGLLQTGTDEEVIEDVKRTLREGMPNYGYIFSTSNSVFTGLDLERYELMNKTWRENGIYR